MEYISTRGSAPALGFADVLLAGLATDGGLYVPNSWPRFDHDEILSWAGLSYSELAHGVMRPFIAGAVADDELDAILEESYSTFDHRAVAPLKLLEPNLFLLELFHGPTLAFKDFALQVVGRLFDAVLERRNGRLTIVGATSGDTGSAAIEACAGRDRVEIFMLHPKGRVSEVQRRQMTTVDAENVHNVAIDGSFDDCQALVKALFNDHAFRDEVRLGAVNSINWARVMAQIVYYYWAALALGGPRRPISFAVPSGNFGNVFAGYCARKTGLPIEQFVVGTNRNDILARFLESGAMEKADVHATLSPSMDIQVSSNFERLLFDWQHCQGPRVEAMMASFQQSGRFEVPADLIGSSRFVGHRLDDDQTLAEIARLYQETGELIDPHSAIGIAAARAQRSDPAVPVVALATAHPAKFPDAVERATGIRPALPSRLANLFERPEHFVELGNDPSDLKAHIRAHGKLKGAA